MSRGWSAVLLPGTLVSMAAGALLPQGAGLLQDRLLETQTESRALEGVRLTLQKSGEVRQTLALLSSRHTMIALREGADRTAEKAEAEARQALELLIGARLLPGPGAGESADLTPAVAIPAAQGGDAATVLPEDLWSGAAVVWECSFFGPDGAWYSVRLDDATGKLVSVGCGAVAFAAAEPLSLRAWADRWAAFFRDYFGADASSVRELYNRGTEGIFELEFDWGEDGGSLSLVLAVDGGSISFGSDAVWMQ